MLKDRVDYNVAQMRKPCDAWGPCKVHDWLHRRLCLTIECGTLAVLVGLEDTFVNHVHLGNDAWFPTNMMHVQGNDMSHAFLMAMCGVRT